MIEIWKWTFLGFESAHEGQPVQSWFDGLPETDRDEIIDVLVQLQNAINRLWRRPEFDPLEGEGGISEIRIPDIRSSKGVAYYRIYGYFGPSEREYTFLHATDKIERNDRDGKDRARDRLTQIQSGDATVHKFDFEKGPVVEIKKGNGSEN
jgi:hypothetical protein